MSTTWISRVRVTGGFLQGLDLSFTPGLNVIVGPRGAGKTSLLESIRFALQPADATHDKSAVKHALGDGEIVIDANTEAGLFRLVVDANGGGTRYEATSRQVLVLGQNELERTANEPRRRLDLLDARAGLSADQDAQPREAIATLTRRLHTLRLKERELAERIQQIPTLVHEREEAQATEDEMIGLQRETLNKTRNELLEIEARMREAINESALAEKWVDTFFQTALTLDSMPSALDSFPADPEMASTIASTVTDLTQAKHKIEERATGAVNVLRLYTERMRQVELETRAAAEPLRSQLEQAESGLGALTSRIRDIDLALATLQRESAEYMSTKKMIAACLSERDESLRIIETARVALFDRRRSIATQITAELGREVTVSVKNFSDTASFSNLIQASLQGSGVRYGAVAAAICARILPTQLLTMVETQAFKELAQTIDIPIDRAERVLQALDQPDFLTTLSLTDIDDTVDFSLLDGGTQKPVERLSTGQKCAVTLPILLTDNLKTVVLDQPEDHLDNQFLVTHIVSRLGARTRAGAQTIIATHNPNIPVLGEATYVAHLQSDGTSSAVQAQGAFNKEDIVSVITNLMEGGLQAFETRAKFYRGGDLDRA